MTPLIICVCRPRDSCFVYYLYRVIFFCLLLVLVVYLLYLHLMFYCYIVYCIGMLVYNYILTSKIPVRWPGQWYGFTLSLIFKYCGGIGLY